MTTIGLKRTLHRSFDETLDALPAALKTEGFGVLTEIDIQDTLKRRIDVDFRRYKIIGACNPKLAHRALSADLDLGVMLPCNVVVYEEAKDSTVVIAVDPMQTAAATHGLEAKALAAEVHARLERVLERLTH
jgi:uncharacterized protein (DUF302 family)